jgi:hypothetical protein
MILNPSEQQKIKWYRCGYTEGKYIVENFGFSPVHLDYKFFYFVETSEFKQIINKIPTYIKTLSLMKNTEQNVSNRIRNWRRNK